MIYHLYRLLIVNFYEIIIINSVGVFVNQVRYLRDCNKVMMAKIDFERDKTHLDECE